MSNFVSEKVLIKVIEILVEFIQDNAVGNIEPEELIKDAKFLVEKEKLQAEHEAYMKSFFI